jgi:hypothetical protein
MVYFQPKNPNLDKFWRVLPWKMLVYFMAIWSIFLPFGTFYGAWVYFVIVWYIFPVLVCCSPKNLATLFLNHKTFARRPLVALLPNCRICCVAQKKNYHRFFRCCNFVKIAPKMAHW